MKPSRYCTWARNGYLVSLKQSTIGANGHNLHNWLEQEQDSPLEMHPSDWNSANHVTLCHENSWWRGITMQKVRNCSEDKRNRRYGVKGLKLHGKARKRISVKAAHEIGERPRYVNKIHQTSSKLRYRHLKCAWSIMTEQKQIKRPYAANCEELNYANNVKNSVYDWWWDLFLGKMLQPA